MTIVDTTLYANGALRLSRHGAGRGGNILVHTASGQSVDLKDKDASVVDERIKGMLGKGSSETAVFNYFAFVYGAPHAYQ